MKMKFGKLIGCSAVVAASLCLAGNASADTVLDGAVWTGQFPPYTEGSLPTTIPQPTTSPNVAFTITSSGSSNMFDMFSSTDNDLTQFLTNNGTTGETVTYTQGSDQVGTNCQTATTGSCGINNDVMEFWGTTYLVSGQTYTFTVDDAMILDIDGVPLINDQTPAYEDTVSAIWTGATGEYNFDIWYDELNGAPAELSSPDFAVTPEPSSLLLLGTGLFGLAFLVFRRSIKPTTTLNASI